MRVMDLSDDLDSPQTTPKPEPKPLALTPTEERLSAKDFCLHVVQSKEYRESIIRRVHLDALPSQVEIRLLEYAYGKPVDRLEVTDVTKRFEGWTTADLLAHLNTLTSTLQTLQETSAAESVH